MNSPQPPPTDAERRLELARRAFKEFSALCFWSSPADLEIGPDDIAWIINELRSNGGHRGYRIAAQLCR